MVVSVAAPPLPAAATLPATTPPLLSAAAAFALAAPAALLLPASLLLPAALLPAGHKAANQSADGQQWEEGGGPRRTDRHVYLLGRSSCPLGLWFLESS